MWHTISAKETIKKLNTNEKTGLQEKEAQERQKKYGENKLNEGKKENIFIKFIKQFNDFMIIILIIASIISAVMAKIDGSNDYIDSIIIIAIVVFNAIMGLVQESKAEKSLEALKQMASPTAEVIRNGKNIIIKGSEVVVGDIIILEAGNYVPADCRLIEAFNLKIDESALTGETVPVLKDANIILKQDIAQADMINMAFATTVVVNGHAKAVVTETGMNTKVGSIAKIIIEDEAPQTPIQKKLEEVGKSLGVICLVICALIFVIGIFKHIEIKEMFMTSIGLAVAAIPEGLPAIVTIMLSIGVTKMAKNNAIIRKLAAVETLGSSSVICSDKTGTLTQNKMTVVEEYGDKDLVLELGTMCTDCNINENNEITGDPTEVAIVKRAMDNGKNKKQLYEEMQRINEISFDSERKLMTTIHRNGWKYRIITKGALDVLISKCTKIYINGQIIELTSQEKEKIINQNSKMADKALRVLGIAYLDVEILPKTISTSEIEKNLVFVGLIGMIDPPREGVKDAISTCKRAGIKTVMITGDHIKTATAIAKDLGILGRGDLAITGNNLDNIPQKKFEAEITKYSVFARVSPEHKVRIVKAFRSTGAVVAMTGDGVNDAPALKNADIGISMGLNGTDVAKNASDMILTDDNFVTIVKAVRYGRNIYDNIKKAIHFLISTNVGEIVTIFVGLLLGIESPLLAIQLLWINLVTDSIPAIALGLEPEDKNIMNRKPKDNKKGIFSDGLWNKIFIEGTMIGMITLLAFAIGNKLYGLEVARTMAFVSLGLLELVHSFNIRSEESVFKVGIFKNKYLVGAFILGAILQIGVVCVPQIAEIFCAVPLNKVQWIITGIISISPIFIIELQKKINEIVFGKVVYEHVQFEK